MFLVFVINLKIFNKIRFDNYDFIIHNKHMEISGTIEDIIYRNNENGYTILEVVTPSAFVTVTGKFPLVGAGESIKVQGDYQINPKYGRQFVAESIEIVKPTSCESIVKYLSSGLISGVGEVTANNIVSALGEDTLNIIENDPIRLSDIRGISKNKAMEIHNTLADIKKMQDAVMFLQQYDISINMAVKIYEEYKGATERVLKANPYKMIEDIDGVGFKTADKIAYKMGVLPDSEFRIRAGVIYTINEIADKQGSTVCFLSELKSMTVGLLGLAEEFEGEVERAITSLEIDGVVRRVIYGDEDAVSLTKFFNYEKIIANKIKLLQNSVPDIGIDAESEILEFEKANKIELHDGQKKAVMSAVKDGVVIITGGPGTGKTTIIKAIIKIFNARRNKCLLFAPTGRAAKRLEEQTKESASTIHRGLENTFKGTMRSFTRNENNPLEADVIIVDEVSMVDSFLASSLFRAIKPGTRLILVGDKDQLPSVGAGNVLADLISSGEVVVNELSRIYRQSEDSMIIENAHLINKQEMPDLSKKSSDFFYSSKSDPYEVQNEIISMVETRIPSFMSGITSEDIQVITPMKAGLAGSIALNEKLQERINPPAVNKIEIEVGKRKFRVGDKVMQTANNYDQEWMKDEGKMVSFGQGVFNGDMGYILDINKISNEVTVLFDDGRRAQYSMIELEDLTHAYAITIHKSQGSEFPVVIIPIMGGNPMLFNKNLLYTAVTRAKKMVVLIGKRGYIYHMVKNEYSIVRHTLLKQFMLNNLPF